jgi:glutaredoxin
MRVKYLIETINTSNATVVFDSPEIVARRLDAGVTTPIYFTCVDEKEKLLYERCKDKSNFVSHTPSIHLPDLSVHELVNIYECDGTGSLEITKDILSSFFSDDMSEDVVFVIYILLHEVGHWFQFANMSNKVEAFLSEDIELSKANFDKMQQAFIQRDERIRRGNSCPLTAKEKALFKQLSLEYREIPKEKDADKYALEHMEEAIVKYYDNLC